MTGQFALRKSWTAGAVAALLDQCRVLGRADRSIIGLAPLDQSQPNCLCFCSSVDQEAAYAAIGSSASDSIILASNTLEVGGLVDQRTVLLVPNPRYAFVKIVAEILDHDDHTAVEVSPLASISPRAELGRNVAIGPFAVVEDGVAIADDCRIGPHAHIARGARLGRGVVVQGHSTIGMIGTACERERAGQFVFMPHLAGVIIGANCRIGPSTTIARGTLRNTELEEGCVVGAQVNIGHNCHVGRHSFIAAGSIMTGSSILGEQCWLGPGAMVANKVRIDRGTTVAMGSVVVRDCGAGLYVAGNPARAVPHTTRFNQGGAPN